MKTRITIGIDEVGRGALAGPVVLAAVWVMPPFRWYHPALGRIRDSKKLTPRRREDWFRHLTTHPKLVWRVARVSHTVIDRINISKAANLGALRLVRSLMSRRPARVLLDGGLALPAGIPHRAIIRGDERIPAIAAASIIAKVTRDRMMVRLGRAYPVYGFAAHKGYATVRHRNAIRRFGPSPNHRRTFLGRVV